MLNKTIRIIAVLLWPVCMLAQSSVEDPMDIVVDDVIAVVGEDIILQSEVETKFIELTYSQEVTDEEQARCDLLDQMILNKVLKTHAIRDSLIVGPDQIEYQLNARLEQIISQVPSVQDFEDYYGRTVNQIKEQLRPLVIDYLLAEEKKKEITADVRVTPAEVKRLYYRVPEEQLPYYNAEVELAQIVMYPEANEEEEQETMEQMRELKERVLNGADFAELAKEYSEDKGTAEKGGDLGFFRKGQMVEEFEDVAFKLAPGELSRVVKSDFGFHLIQVLERRDESVHARHILIKPKPSEETKLETKEEIDSIYHQIKTDSLLFEYAVDLYSEDDQTKQMGGLLFNPQTGTSYFEIDALLEYDPDMYLAIDDLDKGEVSEPFEFTDRYGRTGYRILYVQNQRDAHRMNLEYDFDVIKDRALERKKNEVLYQWLENATSDVFIAVNEQYRSCPNMPIWLKAK